jgi:hypothetical protein
MLRAIKRKPAGPPVEPPAADEGREREPAKGELPHLLATAGAGGRVTVGKGDETAVIARIPMERMESAGVRARPAGCRTRLLTWFPPG